MKTVGHECVDLSCSFDWINFEATSIRAIDRSYELSSCGLMVTSHLTPVSDCSHSFPLSLCISQGR